jgi:D-cysteine desulfhydrase
VRADLAANATLHAARTYFGAALSAIAHGVSRDAYLVPMGGSNVVGSLGYVDAARELAEQVKRKELPEPDVIVVTCGSGGTAAGLAAGLALEKMKTRVVGVVVASPAWFVAFYTYRLLRAVYARAGGRDARALRGRLELVTSELGAGYGEPTDAGRAAMETAREHGLALDLTYTAKCFAGALDYVQTARNENVLYWHTLSSAPLAPLLENAPRDIPASLAKLLR